MRTLLLALALVFGQESTPTDLSGWWTITMDPGLRGNPASSECRFRQTKNSLTVKCHNGAVSGSNLSGTATGSRVTWRTPTVEKAPHLLVTWTGDVDRSGTAMQGTWRFVVTTDETRTGKFTATKRP
jgi:hypothetical protein